MLLPRGLVWALDLAIAVGMWVGLSVLVGWILG